MMTAEPFATMEEEEQAPVLVVKDEEAQRVSQESAVSAEEPSTKRNRTRTIAILVVLFFVVVALVVGLSVGLTSDNDDSDSKNDPCDPNPCPDEKICTPSVDQVDGFLCVSQRAADFTRSSTYMTELCSDLDRRSECKEECAPAACCTLESNETCLSDQAMLPSCVAYSACHVVIDGMAATRRRTRKLVPVEPVEPAPLDLQQVCSPQNLTINSTACDEICRPAACCHLEDYTDLDDYTDCQSSHFLMCLDYAACLDQNETGTLKPAPSNLDELCLSSDTDDRARCEELCEDARCCVSQGDDRCFDTDFLSCVTYSWCLALTVPLPNSEVPAPPLDLQETCSLERILPSKDNRDACFDACDPASCCGDSNATNNCFRDDPLGCVEYSQCGLLLLTGGDVPLPPDDVSTKCSWETISSGPGAGEDCAEVCEQAKCCWDSGGDNCYKDGNFFTCNGYWLCGRLLFEGGSVPSPPEDLESACAWSNLDTTEGYDMCFDACSDGFCCVDRAEEENCFVGNAVDCAGYLPCWPLGVIGEVLPAPDNIATVCSRENLVTQGPAACTEICEPASCCTGLGDLNCFADNPVTCLSYLPCANLLVEGGPLEDPPDNIASVCNFPGVSSYDGCAECKCLCEEAQCCLAEGQDNCFGDGNAAACTKWMVACSILAFGRCGDYPCQGYESVPITLPIEVINRTDVEYLASDEMEGRDNGSPGSAAAQDYMIDQLEPIAEGVMPDYTGRQAFRQEYTSGANVLGLIPGSELSHDYVVVSAHYDHVSTCKNVPGSDSEVCNGANSNAAGVAVVLGIGRAIAALPSPPRRSVLLAFWDQNEDCDWSGGGLSCILGSKYFVENPLVPLKNITAFLDWDTVGLNALPSLRNFSFAVGAETGGYTLKAALASAIAHESLDTRDVSRSLGESRSDHKHFISNHVPSIFFSDATNGCFHTTGDEVKVVDFTKLEKQAKIALKITHDLANTATPPQWTPAPSLIFDDVSTLNDAINFSVENLDLFDEVNRIALVGLQTLVNTIVEKGEDSFNLFDMLAFSTAIPMWLTILESANCDGFLQED